MHLRALFSPATALLNRLMFPKKFLLVATIGAFAIVIPDGILLKGFAGTIAIEQKKLEGIELLQPINKAVQYLQQHRGLSSGLLSGSQELAPKRASKQQDVEGALAAVSQVLPARLREGEAWKSILAAWQSVAASGLTMAASDNTAAHTQLIEQILSFMVAVSDETELTFDTEHDSYYLMDTAVLRQPIVLERLGRLRALGTSVLAKKALDDQSKINISIQLSELLRAQRALAVNLDKLARMRPALAAKLQENSKLLAAQSSQMLKVINEDVLTGKAGTAPQAYFDLATEVIDTGYQLFYEQLIPAQRAIAQERIASNRNEIIFTLAIAILSGGLCFYLTVGTAIAIIEAVKQMRQSAKALAAGDLTERVTVDSRDELHDIANAFNEVGAGFQSLIMGVRKSVIQVTQAAHHLAESSSQIRQSAASQSDAASGMAAAVEQMTVGVDHINSSAQDAKRVSGQSGELSADGGQLVGTVVVEIERIADSVHASAQTIEELGRQSSQISTVVNVIKDIADQTNLLALNAAIEAARAGESGRGFAVVADEVRKLAERTTKSTVEIAETVATIQRGAEEAVGSMKNGVERVNEGVRLAREAGNAMQRIESGASQVVTMVSDISNALREQSIATTNIAKNVEHIAQMAEDNSAAAAGNAKTVEELDRLATGLHDAIGHFQV